MAFLLIASLILIVVGITLNRRHPDPKHEFMVDLYLRISGAVDLGMDLQDDTVESSKSSVAV